MTNQRSASVVLAVIFLIVAGVVHGADAGADDPWGQLKGIELNDDWSVSVGGKARLRFESETDKDFGAAQPSHDAFLLQRYLIHADFEGPDGMRFFLQGKFAHVNDRDKGGLGGLEDHADFHQAFLDLVTELGGESMTVRLGRQELNYGAQRLLSPLDWGNLRRNFDGIKIMTETADWKIDAFAVRPIVNDRANLDDENEDVDFYGIYTTSKGEMALNTDLYFLVLKNQNVATNQNSRAGHRTLYTLGTRLWGKDGAIDYEGEFATQFGTYAGDRIQAWMATLGGGYTFSDVTWSPRLGLLYDYASGDRDPTDGEVTTFNHLFPLGHAWFGYLDKVGRSNIHAFKVQLKAKPTAKLTTWADFHTFFADQDRDKLYSAGGAGSRGGNGSHFIGHELDLTAKYKINKQTTALMGWAHMWAGGFIERSGAHESPDFLYAQVEYKF